VLLRRFLCGEAVLDTENDRFVNQTHRDDVAAAVVRFVTGNAGAGLYNVVDDEPIRLSEAYRWLAETLNRPLPSGKMPAKRKRGASNKRVSNAKLRALGWAPQFPSVREGMEKSVLPLLDKFPVL
jgi:nucleoside-diphosphate-sugar epimerase